MIGDPDNPLPEASFLYRRILTFLGCTALLGLVAWALAKTPAEDVLPFAQSLLAVLVIWLLLYFGGASADDVGRLVASVKLPIGRARAAADLAASAVRTALPAPSASPPPPSAAPAGAAASDPPWERQP